jgi:hypothetical protein
MERSVAIKKLGKLIGKSFGYRIDEKAPTREERAAVLAKLPAARAELDKLKEQRDARYRAILAADAEYQELHAAHKTAHENIAKLSSITSRYRITVGATSTMFFHVKAEGDSWEEVIDKLHKPARVEA